MLWRPWDRTPAPIVDTGALFGALDKFAAMIAGIAGAAANPDLPGLMAQLTGMRSQLSEALATEMAARAKFNADREAAKAQVAANIAALQAKSQAPVPPGSVSLDAHALLEALLERLAE